MNKNTKLSLKELTDTVIEISRNGLSEAAKNFGGDIGSLKESIENSLNFEISGDAMKDAKTSTITFSWTNWATLDPEYIPPKQLMTTLHTLLSVFAAGLGLSCNGSCGAFLYEDDIYAFYESISHQAEAACKRELELANNGHKICHIVSLATSFNITLLHLLHTTLGIISGKIKNTTLKVDANLCGLISAPVSAGNNSDLAFATAQKSIKRHGNFICQKEIADMTRMPISAIGNLLEKIGKAIEDFRLANALDAAADAGLDVSPLVPLPPSATPDVWYSEKEALQFLGVDSWLQLPERFQPAWVTYGNMRYWHEDELLRVQEAMDSVNTTDTGRLAAFA